jgi:hypothetical protein
MRLTVIGRFSASHKLVYDVPNYSLRYNKSDTRSEVYLIHVDRAVPGSISAQQTPGGLFIDPATMKLFRGPEREDMDNCGKMKNVW